MLIHWDIIQNTPEWDQMRLGKITASAASKFITATGKLSTSAAAESAMQLLILKSIFEIEEGFKGNAATEHGHGYEPEVIRGFEIDTSEQVTFPGFCQHEEFPEIGYSPDGHIFEKNEGVEVKSPQLPAFTAHALYEGDKDPYVAQYLMQMRFSMAVSGFDAWNFCVGNPASEKVFRHRIERDEITEKIALLLPELSKKYRSTQAAIFKLYKIQ
tara:strand:+ start:693 stop:1334 length:642 start_codon:yes stop_codon:yes gene_type:complete